MLFTTREDSHLKVIAIRQSCSHYTIFRIISFAFTYLITYNKFFRHHKGFRRHGQICESTSKIIVFMSKKINWWALQDLNLHGVFQPRERPSRLPFRQATHLVPASAFKIHSGTLLCRFNSNANP